MTPQIIQTINAPPILKLPHNLPARIHLSLMSRSFRPKPIQSTIKYAPAHPMIGDHVADYIILYYKDFRVHVTQDTAMIFEIKRNLYGAQIPSPHPPTSTTTHQHNNTIKSIQLLIKQEKAIRSI